MYSSCKGVPRALLHGLRHYVLRAKTVLADFNLVDFNLAVSSPTAKLPNLIPHQIFWLYGSVYVVCTSVKLVKEQTVHPY